MTSALAPRLQVNPARLTVENHTTPAMPAEIRRQHAWLHYHGFHRSQVELACNPVHWLRSWGQA